MKSFFKGFVYAGRGIVYCFKNERNMRVHLCFMTYMFSFLTFFDFFEISRAEYAVLLALCALVLSLEAVNTAIERTVNLVTSEYRPLAGAAKDTAAAAVLISALFSIAAGIVIMFQPEAFQKMFEYYSTHYLMLVILFLSLILSLIFVFLPSYLKSEKRKNQGAER